MIGRQTPDEELNIFTGAVLFEHDSVLLYCDSAVLRNKANTLDAYNNIRIKINDTLNLYGNLLFYDGNTRLATVIDDVKLVDNDATLFTDKLWFNRNSGIGYYNTNGRIINNENELVSREGYFHTNTKILYFKKNVVLTNPDYRLESDTLVYNTSTEIAYISGPTTIRGKDEFMYAEEGWYETKNGKTMLKTNPYVIDGERYIAGDTIFYEKDIDAGDVFGNVFLKDTIQKLNVQGDYCKYRRGEGYAFVTQKPWATFVEKNDSLWL
ncbi:MAG: LPS export ABC transporter periplasmic protein LptC, partial [Lentimicrobium sp.]|nr:LPS export ABC transporter periplasmic protein LptC [Lentimicrobium sp.]